MVIRLIGFSLLRHRRKIWSLSHMIEPSHNIQYEPRGNGLCVRERDVRVKKGRKP